MLQSLNKLVGTDMMPQSICYVVNEIHQPNYRASKVPPSTKGERGERIMAK
jgi:hypothetical protein